MPSDETRSLDQLVKVGDVAMVTTVDAAGRLTSRPLTVADVHAGVLCFLVDATADWVTGMQDAKQVNAAIAASGRNDWVSVGGPAAVGQDRGTIERLWNPAAAAYFDGKDDPNIAALQVTVDVGEYWSAPPGGPIGRLASVIGAALGKPDAVGDHGAVARD